VLRGIFIFFAHVNNADNPNKQVKYLTVNKKIKNESKEEGCGGG
jgi:hypothetical protein